MTLSSPTSLYTARVAFLHTHAAPFSSQRLRATSFISMRTSSSRLTPHLRLRSVRSTLSKASPTYQIRNRTVPCMCDDDATSESVSNVVTHVTNHYYHYITAMFLTLSTTTQRAFAATGIDDVSSTTTTSVSTEMPTSPIDETGADPKIGMSDIDDSLISRVLWYLCVGILIYVTVASIFLAIDRYIVRRNDKQHRKWIRARLDGEPFPTNNMFYKEMGGPPPLPDDLPFEPYTDEEIQERKRAGKPTDGKNKTAATGRGNRQIRREMRKSQRDEERQADRQRRKKEVKKQNENRALRRATMKEEKKRKGKDS